jgi:hypothetical protein
MEGVISSSRKDAQVGGKPALLISEEGIAELNRIVGEKRAELSSENEKRMLEELMRDPDLFDPKGRFNDSKTDISVRIPLWVYYWLERRKRTTGESISKQISEIVTEYVASEILDIIELARK